MAGGAGWSPAERLALYVTTQHANDPLNLTGNAGEGMQPQRCRTRSAGGPDGGPLFCCQNQEDAAQLMLAELCEP